jgi:ATP-dependent helicase YprA (DUF1998 family)
MGRSRSSSDDFTSAKPISKKGTVKIGSDKSMTSINPSSLLIEDKKRTDKRDDKVAKKDDKKIKKEKTYEVEKVMTRRMSAAADQLNEDSHEAVVNDEYAEKGAFSKFPQITEKTVEGLKKRGIKYLFPIQYESFDYLYKRGDMMGRDLTGSGKTMAFALPMIEYFRKHKCFGSKKI